MTLGICGCGCGEATPISSRTDAGKGYVKGQPRRWVPGHNRRGIKHSLETRQKMSATRTGQRWSSAKRASMEKAIVRGPDHPDWKGDNISYSTLHQWVNRALRKTGACTVCGALRITQWANLSGHYRRDLSDFAEMCVPCHLRHDWTLRLAGFPPKRQRR